MLRTHYQQLILLLLLVGISACSHLPQSASLRLPELSSDAFGEAIAVPSPSDIYALPDDTTQDLQRFTSQPHIRRMPRHEQLFAYLEYISQYLQYDTRTVSSQELLSIGYGNCLSLAVLTRSLADALNVRTSFEVLNDAPVFETQGSIINKAMHVRTILHTPKTVTGNDPYQQVAIRRPTLIVDFFPEESGDDAIAEPIDKQQFLARYYLNLSAETLTKNQLNTSFWLAREALNFDPESLDALNILAILYRRAGDTQSASTLYEVALNHDPRNITLLKNYRTLAQLEGDEDKAHRIDQRLRLLNDPSPINWVASANGYLDDGDYSKATQHFREAIKKAPYLHEAYLGLAKAYTLMGKFKKAETALSDAMEHVESHETRQKYHNKWAALRNR